MTTLVAGFLLGVAGSGHCLGMCGPLMLFATGGPGQATATRTARLAPAWLLHHAGRLLTYTILGAAAGLTGGAMAWAGFRTSLAVAAGLLLVLQAFGFTTRALGAAPARYIGAASARLAGLAASWPRHARSLALGAVNGLLPCGLLYAALAAAAGLGDARSAIAFTAAFGVGSLPAFIVLAYAARALGPHVPRRVRVMTPVVVGLVGVMLLLRGLAMPQSHDMHVHPAAAAQPANPHR